MMQVVLDPIASAQDSPVRILTRRRVSKEEYREFCALNSDLRIERSAEGELIVMRPALSRVGARNSELTFQVQRWARQDGNGVGFDSSSGFDLPNGSNRSPDASWVLKSRIEALAPGEREEFLPLCPDFVAELRSSSDRIAELHEKMEEYIGCGAQLGWLIDPLERRVWIYRSGAAVEALNAPATLTADPLMPGFVLDLASIWQPQF
jgi:Uma2 family endonuclease